jgi:DNA-binding NarL/FixJ family response regulator
MTLIRILLADDHDLVRAGLRALLHVVEGLQVVAEAANGREALRLIDEHRPDVVLMDIMMPELNGLDVTARATAEFPTVRVLILSMNAGEECVLRALRAGAAGYLPKNSSPTELELAIRTVARGELYLGVAISKQLLVQSLRRPGQAITSLERLTSRQRETLQLIAEGYSAKEIAQKLNISVRTAELHRAQLMEALDIHDIAGLVRYAMRMGLIVPDS